jgi:putative acetyltransferase
MIRYARAGDRPAIADTVEAAFGRPDEARLVERLRADGDMILELVAEQDGQVAGHVLISRLFADRNEMFAALAPLAVQPGLQRTGLGKGLVRMALEQAREFGVHGMLVLGDPAYYGRFGFAAETAAQVRSPYAGSPSFMALALEGDPFAVPLNVAYPSAFSG